MERHSPTTYHSYHDGGRAPGLALAPAGLPTLAAACALPTCLGFYKREYGVSYGYGLSSAAAAS